MFPRISIFLVCLIAIIFAKENLFKSTIRRYFIKKDAFSGLKLSEFSVFDSSKEQLLYRIESFYTLGGKIQVIDQSSKEVIGELRNKFSVTVPKTNFTILDPISKKWINGNSKNKFHVYNQNYLIQWNNKSVRMDRKFLSSTTLFVYENQNQTLAKLEKHSYSLFRSAEYDLEIFSNDLPDTIYFFGLCMKDNSERPKGGKG